MHAYAPPLAARPCWCITHMLTQPHTRVPTSTCAYTHVNIDVVCCHMSIRHLYTYVLYILTSSLYLRPLNSHLLYIPTSSIYQKRLFGVNPYGKNVVWCESVWTLADCEWRAAAKGLKPLRLPRAPSICHLYTPYPINLHTHHRHLPALERLQKMSVQVGLAVLAQEIGCTCTRDWLYLHKNWLYLHKRLYLHKSAHPCAWLQVNVRV